MSILDWFSKLYAAQAHHCVYARIATDHLDAASRVDAVTASAEQHYFRIWLSEMFLADDRRLFREFTPVVHSAVRLQFAGNPAQELPYVAGPQNIGLGTTLGRGVQLNHQLTNLLPYRGGSVAVSAGLFAYKSKDFFQQFTDTLHDVSGLFNVGQLSQVIEVAGKAVDGIQSLLGAGDKDIHLVYFESFAGTAAAGGSELESGYTAIINADAGKFDTNRLFVKQRQLCYGADLASAVHLDGSDYLLLRTEVAERRDDFMSFPEFARLLNEAIKAGVADRKKGDEIIQASVVTAYACPDLTWIDKGRVAAGLNKAYRDVVGAGRGLESTLNTDEWLARSIGGLPDGRLRGALGLGSGVKQLAFGDFARIVASLEQ